VNIPLNFYFYNNGVTYEDIRGARFGYSRFLGETERAANCTACRVCEEKCPQKIPISEWLTKVHETLRS
jgi:predicted aldo/keto reductase-like oxidoreductase